jgi:hypothetical protein
MRVNQPLTSEMKNLTKADFHLSFEGFKDSFTGKVPAFTILHLNVLNPVLISLI